MTETDTPVSTSTCGKLESIQKFRVELAEKENTGGAHDHINSHPVCCYISKVLYLNRKVILSV